MLHRRVLQERLDPAAREEGVLREVLVARTRSRTLSWQASHFTPGACPGAGSRTRGRCGRDPGAGFQAFSPWQPLQSAPKPPRCSSKWQPTHCCFAQVGLALGLLREQGDDRRHQQPGLVALSCSRWAVLALQRPAGLLVVEGVEAADPVDQRRVAALNCSWWQCSQSRFSVGIRPWKPWLLATRGAGSAWQLGARGLRQLPAGRVALRCSSSALRGWRGRGRDLRAKGPPRRPRATGRETTRTSGPATEDRSSLPDGPEVGPKPEGAERLAGTAGLAGQAAPSKQTTSGDRRRWPPGRERPGDPRSRRWGAAQVLPSKCAAKPRCPPPRRRSPTARAPRRAPPTGAAPSSRCRSTGESPPLAHRPTAVALAPQTAWSARRGRGGLRRSRRCRCE